MLLFFLFVWFGWVGMENAASSQALGVGHSQGWGFWLGSAHGFAGAKTTKFQVKSVLAPPRTVKPIATFGIRRNFTPWLHWHGLWRFWPFSVAEGVALFLESLQCFLINLALVGHHPPTFPMTGWVFGAMCFEAVQQGYLRSFGNRLDEHLCGVVWIRMDLP